MKRVAFICVHNSCRSQIAEALGKKLASEVFESYSAGTVSDWIAQFSFGFYSIMLTSTIIGFAVNILFKPRAWCSFCPMGTMTQMICKIKAKEKL